MARIRDEGIPAKYRLSAQDLARAKPGPMNWNDLHVMMTDLRAAAEGRGTLVRNVKPRTEDIVALGEEINQRVKKWLDGYVWQHGEEIGYYVFWYHWKIIRVWMPLQFRLAVEQVLYDRGYPWRNLVTGFGTIKED